MTDDAGAANPAGEVLVRQLHSAVARVVRAHVADEERARVLLSDLHVAIARVILPQPTADHQPSPPAAPASQAESGPPNFQQLHGVIHSIFGGARRGGGLGATAIMLAWPRVAAILVPMVREIAGDEEKMRRAESQLQSILARYMEPKRARAVALGLMRMARMAAGKSGRQGAG